MKAIKKVQFRHVTGAAAALLLLMLTAQVGLAAGPDFGTSTVTLGSITFEDGAQDYSIERAGGVRLEFEVDNGGGDLFMFAEKATGRISFGDSTTPPDAPFHFRPTDDGSDARILVANDVIAAAPRNMFQLRNNGGPRFILQDTNFNPFFTFALNPAGNFIITRAGVAGAEFTVSRSNGFIDMGPGTTTSFRVTNNGVLATNYGQLSDREAKTDIEELDNGEVLSKIKEVPVSSWRFKGNDDPALHIGPMAQDFHEVFGTGTSDRVINVGDLAGVALAGVKSLTGELEARDVEVRELRERLNEERSRSSELEERIGRLERLLKKNQL